MKLKGLFASAAVAVVLVATQASIASASMSHHRDGLAELRAATAKYHSITKVEKHDYAEFFDTAGISCIAEPGMGAMGVHYVNGTLVGNPKLIPTKPEAILYAPDKNGRLHLAAVEYIVVKDAWDATHASPPRMYGQDFNFTDAPNRFGLPPFYSLHVWAWQHNPAGLFEMWNPNVVCPA
jgi:hypothetical protein